MSRMLKAVNAHQTVQTAKADPRQVLNNAGGFVFQITDVARLERFLILGTDKPTYYAGAQKLTDENVDFVKEMLSSKPFVVINKVVEISAEGRAKSNSPALFVLALAMNTDGVDKSAVSAAVAKVARTSTHLFEYAQYLKNLGGWGRAKRQSVADWYESKSADKLAYQAVKYRQRDGWTHRDLFRLSHPKGVDQSVGNFILGKDVNDGPRVIEGFKRVQAAKKIDEVVSLVQEYNLPWETVPTEFHKELKLWRSLFESDSLGQTALLRNVTRFAKLGAFDDLKFAADFAARLSDAERIQRGLIHPISYLNALVVYSEGQIDRKNAYGWTIQRNKTWDTNGKVSAALDAGFYSAFKNVQPADKRTLVALDVSGSMSVAAAQGADLTAAQVSGAMAMFIARTEPYSLVRGFSHTFKDLGISDTDSLPTVINKISNQNFGSTDCSLPMQWAEKNNVEIDTFIVVTDNETYHGRIHPFQALKQYRKATGIDARLGVMAVTPTRFSIADASDRGMLDVVGFDSNAPKAIADFSAGRI